MAAIVNGSCRFLQALASLAAC
uniref:Uncharacterized protein n=1 Tax=Anguilla anguilla TaxID=7936 RepID=A0A0E9VMJ7_ANGAN